MKKVIGFVMVGTNDLKKSSNFYDSILIHIGLKKVSITDRYIGYGQGDGDHDVKFYITKPHDEKDASVGNGTMIALSADSQESVNKFHATALENGGVDEWKPGIRSDGNYYGYIRDLDGNKITARYVIVKWSRVYLY